MRKQAYASSAADISDYVGPRLALNVEALRASGIEVRHTETSIEFIPSETVSLSHKAVEAMATFTEELGLSPADREELFDLAVNLQLWARVRQATR